MGDHRRIPALLTLMALTFSLAETAVASVCVHGAPDTSGSASHAEHAGMPETPPPDSPASDQFPDCPLSFVAGCTPSTPLRATSSITFDDAPEAVISIPAPSLAIDHVLSNLIFHPPR